MVLQIALLMIPLLLVLIVGAQLMRRGNLIQRKPRLRLIKGGKYYPDQEKSVNSNL
jgi:hypothetical protein